MTEIAISSTLKDMIEQIANAVANAAELVNMAVVQAKAEGLSNEQTRELIVTALKKRNLSDRTIKLYLPDELKSETAKALGSKGGNSSASKPSLQTLQQKSENTTQSEKPTDHREPDPTRPPPSQHDDKPTDEPEEKYHGDAGNNPNLIKKYVDEKPLKWKKRMNKKYLGAIFVINQNFGKVQDFDIEIEGEGDVVTAVNPKPIMRAIVK